MTILTISPLNVVPNRAAHSLHYCLPPLAIALRSSQMQGISRGGIEHKLSLYADDLLVFLSHPPKSIPLVLNVLKEFGHISAYILNLCKSELMPVKALPEIPSHNYRSEHLWSTLNIWVFV